MSLEPVNASWAATVLPATVIRVTTSPESSPFAHPATYELPAASPDPGSFSFPLTVNTDNTQVDINYTYGNKNAYVQGCTNVAGTVVTRITVQTAPQTVAKLAFTGSSETPTYLLIGFGALAVGVVLVVASRRRSRVHG